MEKAKDAKKYVEKKADQAADKAAEIKDAAVEKTIEAK